MHYKSIFKQTHASTTPKVVTNNCNVFLRQTGREGPRHWEEAALALVYQTDCVKRTGC